MFLKNIGLFLNFLFFCQLSIYHGVHAVNSEFGIEFYAGENHKDLLYEVNTNQTTKCKNFQIGNGILNVRSVNTTQCWILHRDPDCESASFSEKISTNISWETFHQIGSFQPCPEIIGGPSLNVDLTKYNNNKNVPDVLESYKDVCTCHDIPEHIHFLEKWSINNHGNDMVAYFEKGCQENKFKSVNIPAGNSQQARGISIYEKTEEIDPDDLTENMSANLNRRVYRIQSFGPNINSSYFKATCLKFNATVLKFEIEDKAEFEESSLEIEMFNNVFRNDRSNRLSTTYFVSKEVQETFHVEMDSNSLIGIEYIEVDEDFEVESNFDQNVFKEQAIREILRRGCSKIGGNIQELSSFKTFSVKEVMNVPPCTEHKVNAHVNMLKNDGIQFRALMKVGGYIKGGGEMSADEVKRYLDGGMEYRGKYDENSVMAYAKGTIGMKFGASLVIEGEDISIPECVAYNQLLTCPACEVCY